MKMFKRFTALAIVLVLVLCLAACGNSSSSSDGGSSTSDENIVTENAIFRTLYSGEVSTLNYLITGTTNELEICANVVDCLVEYDSYGNVLPALATSWEQNSDATVFTFHIREGVKWVDKDGNEVADVTANDWVSSAYYVCDANNASSTFYTYSGIIKGADAYYDYTAYLLEMETFPNGIDDEGNEIEEVPVATLEDIGVKALDEYTLEYTLEAPCPYFISMVSFGPYMPVLGSFLEEKGSAFGTTNDDLLYCGAFILSDFQPQVQRVLTKNQSYWDVDHVYLDGIQETYNAEAGSVETTMYLNGQIDSASIDSNVLSTALADPDTADLIHPTRADVSYSYWYLFNFDPQFDDMYEPDNWNLAVNNENFRQSVMHAFNRISALAVKDSIDPSSLMNNTITPLGFCSASKDYAYYGELAGYTDGDTYDPDLALEYRDAAIEELTAAGATFPIKVLMSYNPSSTNAAEECQMVEQLIEGVLNTDDFEYIDIILEAGPSDNFLSTVRRGGKYAFMSCNWGADYADPQTWTDPFVESSTYSYIYKSEDPTTQALYAEYLDLVEKAKSITDDMDARYEAFAEAEALLLDHAFVVPYSISNRTYTMSNLNAFEGQYASFGMANLRYKGMHLYTTSMNMDEYQEAYDEWAAVLAG